MNRGPMAADGHRIVRMLLLATPIAATAHGTAPAALHGGVVGETSDEHWLELVIKGDDISIHLSDQANRPVPAAGTTAKIALLAGGKSQQVTLTPGAANSLTGKLETRLFGKVTAAITLSIGVTSTQARLILLQP